MLLNDFLRFKMEVSLKRPLVAGFPLSQRRSSKDWHFVKYKTLPLFCFKYGVIGHEDHHCLHLKKQIEYEDGLVVPLYGLWLC